MSKNLQLLQKIFEKNQGKCKKSGCLLCKSENPLCKKIPSDKNLLLEIYEIFSEAL